MSIIFEAGIRTNLQQNQKIAAYQTREYITEKTRQENSVFGSEPDMACTTLWAV